MNLLFKNAALPFFPLKFLSLIYNLFLGQSCGQPSEGCFIPEKWGLSRSSMENFVSLCFAYVDIHKSQTPDPLTGKNKVTCQLVLLFLLQLLSVHELFEEVMEKRILYTFNKQQFQVKALLMKFWVCSIRWYFADCLLKGGINRSSTKLFSSLSSCPSCLADNNDKHSSNFWWLTRGSFSNKRAYFNSCLQFSC